MYGPCGLRQHRAQPGHACTNVGDYTDRARPGLIRHHSVEKKHLFVFFYRQFHFQLNSHYYWYRRFYPQRHSGQAVVTDVFPVVHRSNSFYPFGETYADVSIEHTSRACFHFFNRLLTFFSTPDQSACATRCLR